MLAKKSSKKKKITIEGTTFDITSLSAEAKNQLSNLEFVDQQIAQKNNELQVADSARIVYYSVLKSDLTKLAV